MTVAVVVVCWNGALWIEDSLRSIFNQSRRPAILVVVDNASVDGSLAIIDRIRQDAAAAGTPITVLQHSSNLGFTAGANAGLRHCLALEPAVDSVVLLNQDATLDADWCERVEAAFGDDEAIGAIGGTIVDPDRRTIQHAGGYVEQPWLFGRHFGHHEPVNGRRFGSSREVEFVTAAAMALRSRALREVGPFNEVFSPGYYEDVELCARLRDAGWVTWYCPEAVATHRESASFANRIDRLRLSHRNRLLYGLPWLVEPVFRDDFTAAERRFIESALPEERRALSLAYLSALLRLPVAARLRDRQTPMTSTHVTDIANVLVDLREFALARLRLSL